MKGHLWIAGAVVAMAAVGCARRPTPVIAPPAAPAGAVLVEAGGGGQLGAVGTLLAQPLVVQVNDAQGVAVAGVPVKFRGPAGVSFEPAQGLTDSSGQLSTSITLGGIAGRYQIMAIASGKAGKEITLTVNEITTGYQQQLGYQLDQKYCARCHNPESSPERVSNYDNLAVKPHPFTEGETMNRMSDADLIAIISHGGPALNRSALMPPYGSMFNKDEMQALVAYIRLVSEPPYHVSGIVYAKQ